MKLMSGTRMSLGQVLAAALLSSVLSRKVLKSNDTEFLDLGLTCYGDQLDDGKMCSSVTNLLKCPNSFARVDAGTFVQCEVVDGQCLTTGGKKQKLCKLATCDGSLAVDLSKNLAEGVVPTVSSECYKRNPTNKGFLTDGDTRANGHGDRNYWHSCRENNPRAEVAFPMKCVREVKIWSRADCCSSQMQGVMAEVWSDGKWKRCGGVSGNVGQKNSFSFKCAIAGTKVRIIKKRNHEVMTTSELQVFGALNPQLPMKTCSAAMHPGKVNLVVGRPVKVSSDCFRNARHKKFLTDGDTRKGRHGNDHYWHSCNQRHKWAQVDFPETCVRKITIWSRPNCCPNQMQNVVAHIWSQGRWVRCGAASPNIGKKSAPYSFDCAMVGSKVRISRNEGSWMSISELEVFGPSLEPVCDVSMSVDKRKNLALKAPVRVSSDCYRNARHKKFMVDGDRRVGKRGNDHYWHSCNQRNKWAEVTIPEQCVRQVQIWSRPNCCSNQMQGVVAHVLSDGKWKRCGGVSPNVNKLAAPYAFDCGIVGSKVRVTRNHHTWMTIGELEVFGPGQKPSCDVGMGVNKGKNLALKAPVRVSSDCYRNARHRKFMVDGDRRVGKRGNDHYWHSCNQRNKWAEVTIPEQCVRQVQIWSRPNCCSNQMQGVVAHVFSDGKWKRCGGVSPNVNKLAAPYAFDCGIVGSKVRVTRNHHTWFTIGELEVFGPQVGPVEPKCDGSMSISKKNLALGKKAKVSSECYKRNPTNKGYLTDGDNRVRGRRDRKYWHSCAERNPNAVVEFPSQCVREVKIWSRADCCSGQMQGVMAEIWSGGQWKRCGGISNNVGRKRAYSFKCSIVGTQARIIKKTNRGWITTSEMEVFGAEVEPKCDTSMAVDRKNLARGKRAKVSSECYKRNPTNKGYLTDGDNRVRGRRDRKYWHSCAERNPHAQVEVGKKCIREVKIWSRADCCSHQMQGVTAEVYSHGKWKRCGGISNNVGRKKAYTFKCAIVGTHARIIKRTNRGWITTSEMEVFAAK